MADHDSTPEVPELALATTKVRAVSSGQVTKVSRVSFDDDPRDEPSLELAIEPRRPDATGVRSWPCPVCQAELPRDVFTCPECGERMMDDPFAPYSAYVVAPDSAIAPRPAPRWLQEVADVLPIGVAKRIFVYPLLFAFFANLFVPCRFHSTGVCVLIAAIGFLGVIAHHRTQPL